MSVYSDYTMKFPQTGLAQALQALKALQASGVLDGASMPENMLGTPRDDTGAVDFTAPTWKGDPGRAASSYTDPDTGQVVQMQAAGDPTCYYIAIRGTVAPSALPFDPATYGLQPSTAAESAAVLGVWA